MAHNSTENLIQSDSSTSTDELNNGSGSHSAEKVSKKMFHKKKTAFVGANSVTSPSSSITSSPQQHPIIVVGTADVHQPQQRLSPPKPFPRKHLMTPVEPTVTKRKQFFNVDDITDVSGESESNNSLGKKNIVNSREVIELSEIKSVSESSGGQSDKTEEPKMFFARSRKNTIVTNIDEVSVKSSSTTNKSSRHVTIPIEVSKPLPKPIQQIQSEYEIVDEKPFNKRIETLQRDSKDSYSEQSKSFNSDSESFSDTEISKTDKQRTIAEQMVSDGQVDQDTIPKDYQHDKIIGNSFFLCDGFPFLDHRVETPRGIALEISDKKSEQHL